MSRLLLNATAGRVLVKKARFSNIYQVRCCVYLHLLDRDWPLSRSESEVRGKAAARPAIKVAIIKDGNMMYKNCFNE